jgi:hypothetical protein
MPQRTLIVVLLVFLVGLTDATAADPGRTEQSNGSTAADRWTYSVSAYYFAFPHESDYWVGLATANRDALHLQARYNYENINAGSIFAGWTFAAGETFSVSVTPIVGAVFGTTQGVAPGAQVAAAYRSFDFYFEGEYVFDVQNRGNSYFYAWTELAAKPVEWLRGGFVGQRTSINQSDRSIQLGGFAQLLFGRTSFGVYLFNPGSTDWFAATSLELRF